jgi:hypothetical protein
MRRNLPGELVVLLLVSALPLVAAPQEEPVDKETIAIRNAVQLYLSPDLTKVKEAFYPAANLYMATDKGDLRIIPLEQFLANIAKGTAAGEQRPLSSIDFIDRVGNAATVRMTEISRVARVTDYFSLIRGSAGWRVVSKTFNLEHKTEANAAPAERTGHAPDQNLCPSAEARTLDFLAGYWATSESPTPASGPATGTSRTEKILNGCAIWEHRYVEQQGKELFDAHLVLGYDVTTKRMLLFYVDDLSHTQLYEGRRENENWAFYRERPSDDGKTILIRVKYAQKGKGFTQTVERSKDHGKSWAGGSVVTYEPKH